MERALNDFQWTEEKDQKVLQGYSLYSNDFQKVRDYCAFGDHGVNGELWYNKVQQRFRYLQDTGVALLEPYIPNDAMVSDEQGEYDDDVNMEFVESDDDQDMND